jgi:hypothetical protein
MGLVISKGLTLRKGWQPMDTDAAAYITAVETADGQALEEKTKIAIDNFVLGCKADGIWDAIKASCILAGARTLSGALVPLAGTAPTNFNFASGDYNRKTGLVGDGSTKYLNANRLATADPFDNRHLAAYRTISETRTGNCAAIGFGTSAAGGACHLLTTPTLRFFRMGTDYSISDTSAIPGLFAASRTTSTALTTRYAGTTTTVTTGSPPAPSSVGTFVFSRDPAAPAISDARIAFYSIGESLDLALLDARVTDLINAFAAAIP